MTLHLYILRQVLLALLFSAGGMVFIAVPGLAVSAMSKVGGTGVASLLRYLPLAGAELLPYLVPVGFLLALVATFGRLAADGEWTAMVMAGLHPARLLLMPLLLALVLFAVTSWVLSEITPHLLDKQRTFLKESAVRAFKTLNPGRTDLSFGDFHLNGRFRDGVDTWRDAFIQIPNLQDESNLALRADRVRIWFPTPEEVAIDLWGCRAVLRNDQRSVASATEYLPVRAPLDQLFSIPPARKTRPRYFESDEIFAMLRAGSVPEKRSPHEFEYELHSRFALSSTYLLFLVLGVPTALMMRRGSGLGALAVAVGYGLLYYLLSLRLGQELSTHRAVPAWVGAWATDLFGYAAGCALLWRAFKR